MMPAVTPEPPNLPIDLPLVVPYRRTTPPIVDRQGWTVGEVMLGLLVGLLTTILGLPLFLMWAYRNLHWADGWGVPLAIYAGIVVAMLLAAFSVRRRHQLPGLLPGLSAGIAGGLLIIGVVVFYAMHA